MYRKIASLANIVMQNDFPSVDRRSCFKYIYFCCCSVYVCFFFFLGYCWKFFNTCSHLNWTENSCPNNWLGIWRSFWCVSFFVLFFRYFVALYFTTTFFVCLKLTRFKQWQTFVGRCKVVLKAFSKQMIIHYDCFHPMYSWYFRASAPFFFYFHVSMC